MEGDVLALGQYEAPFSRAVIPARGRNILCSRLYLSILDNLNDSLRRDSSGRITSTRLTPPGLLVGLTSPPSQPVRPEERYRHSTRVYTSTHCSIIAFS